MDVSRPCVITLGIFMHSGGLGGGPGVGEMAAAGEGRALETELWCTSSRWTSGADHGRRGVSPVLNKISMIDQILLICLM